MFVHVTRPSYIKTYNIFLKINGNNKHVVHVCRTSGYNSEQ